MSNCSIVRDLLPLYLDGETSPETSDMIREHLAECEECRRYYSHYNRIPRAMQDPASHGKYHYSEVARRIRRRNTIKLSVLCAAFLSLGYLIAFLLFPNDKK